LLGMPVCYGGFGLRSAFNTRIASYWSSMAQAAPTIQRLCPQLPASTQEAITAAHRTLLTQTTVNGDRHQALPQDVTNAIQFYSDAPELAAKLQHDLTHCIEAKQYQRFLEQADPVEKARLLSIAGPWASAALTVIPTDKSLQLDNGAYRLFALQRLGLPLTAQMPERCVCGAEFEHDEAHALSCIFRLGSLNTDRHDEMGEVVQKYARRAGWLASVRPHWLYSGELRPDGDFISDSGREIIDFTVSHPTATSNVERACQGKLAVTIEAERQKRRKYAALAESHNAIVTPFALETFGAFGDRARDLVKRIAKSSKPELTGYTPHQILYGLSNEVAIALQKSNARIINSCFREARRSQSVPAGVRFFVRLH